jgi:hypothetical protein
MQGSRGTTLPYRMRGIADHLNCRSSRPPVELDSTLWMTAVSDAPAAAATSAPRRQLPVNANQGDYIIEGSLAAIEVQNPELIPASITTVND